MTGNKTSSETIKPSQKFYMIDLTDTLAKKIEAVHKRAAALLEDPECIYDNIRKKLTTQSKRLHVTAIYQQRAVSGLGNGKSGGTGGRKKNNRCDELLKKLEEGEEKTKEAAIEEKE